MTLLSALQIFSCALGVFTAICYFYQIIYLFLPLFRKQPSLKTQQLCSYAILIAARNEASVLPHLLASIQAQNYPRQLITTYVVADNCTDATAQAALDGGARVFTRLDKTRIGKGFALDFLLKQIDQQDGLDSYDAFLVFDADNLLSPDYISQINTLCSSGFDAFCGYRNSKNFGTNWICQGYGLWYLHDSCHLNQSRMLLGTTCAVSGTGFGFTRQLLRRLGGWNFFTLTEDIEFNAWCATQGIRIGYCRNAVLFDEQPETFAQSWRQRTRWTQGGIQVSLRYAGALLRGLFKGGWTSYASFETATLSLWGYGIGALCGALALLTSLLAKGWAGLGTSILAAVVGTYVSMFFIGGLTLLSEWGRIRATTRQKFQSLFTFPLFMITFIPIALTAVFRKFQWQPIHHTVAISAKDLIN